MGKVRILHIIKSLGRGGAEMLLPETLKLHDKTKFEFHYIYFLPWKDQMVNEIEISGGIVSCFEAKNNIYLIFQLNNVIKYCKQHEIDIIHCHLPWAGFLGRAVYKKTKIPTLYTEHNMQERYHKITKKINQLTFNFQSLALGVSKDVTNSIVENIHPNIRVQTLLNGVNTDTFVRNRDESLIRKELNIPKNAIVFGNVAVFRFQKRLKEWLKIFKKINDKNSNVYGIIVGAGPLENEIKTELHTLNLSDKVFFPGLQTNVKPYFEAMDVFMMSSSFEGLPIALLEAMSMECAVISTNAGGIKEVIRHEKDGFLCEVKNWEFLTEYAQKLIKDPVLLKSYKENARLRVKENFSLKSMVNSLEEYYLQTFKATKNGD